MLLPVADVGNITVGSGAGGGKISTSINRARACYSNRRFTCPILIIRLEWLLAGRTGGLGLLSVFDLLFVFDAAATGAGGDGTYTADAGS